jgi:hypothetical protein
MWAGGLSKHRANAKIRISDVDSVSVAWTTQVYDPKFLSSILNVPGGLETKKL